MKGALVAVVVAMLIECSLAVGQTGGAGSPVPGMGATSPLGMTPGSSVPPVGIPLGATEMVSPGLSPSLAAAGMAGSDPMCSAMGSPSAGASGSSINDGGGLGMGTGTPLPGSAISFGACSTNASSAASSSAAISSSSPGGISRTGIPLGSVKLGDGGISASPVPSSPMSTMSPAPTAATPAPSSPLSTTDTLSAATLSPP